MGKKTYDLKSLRNVFESIDDNKSKLALNLLDKIEFMEETLQELQEQTRKNGVVTEMCQGKYNIERANPSLQAYNVTMKNYQSAIKQLVELLPEKSKEVEGESILKFVAK